MRVLKNGGRLIESPEDIPNIPHRIEHLIYDAETTSGNNKLDSLNPFHHCEILGLAFSFDESPAFYLPMRHRGADHGRNLEISVGNRVCQQLVHNAVKWTNHNVKYDMHVSVNSGGCDPERMPEIVQDTLTLGKLVDSDRFHYDLEALSHDYCYEDISHFSNPFNPWLRKPNGDIKCHDYGIIPIDDMAPYACQDVITEGKLLNALLHKLICERS